MGQRDILLQIVNLFNKYQISYFLTGSLAVSYYGYPRATHDIDFVLEYKSKDSNNIIEVLKKLGKTYLIDFKSIKASLLKYSQFEIYHTETGMKIDFWSTGNDEFEINRFNRRQSFIINKKKIYICSAEDLIINKLIWCKEIRSEKHLRDCAGIIKIQKGKMDNKYLEKWIKKFNLKDLYREAVNMDY